ncbi:MAG: endo alpha-1,4 polygalactosaminidase [Melioribacteraceae bacterium]|nr:endo alpha-1,4 polygalactosaminidase [Melioribacteraceae bacterium]
MKPFEFYLLVLILFVQIPAQDMTNEKLGLLNSPLPLEQVKYWAYQIQDISYPGAVDYLVNSKYDMLVLEPTCTDWSSDDKLFDTAEMINRIKNSAASDGVHRKLVIAYIDIGEAEDWRWYWNWSYDWDCEPPLPQDWPSYIVSCDPDGWSGNYPVAYWDENWQDLTIWGQNQNSQPYGDYTSIIDETILHGFDGIYLDWVEAFEDERVMTRAQLENKDPAVEMINFIQKMRDYASIRNPEFIIIQQNAASLIEGHPELLSKIDAIAQEAVWYDGDADVDWENPAGYDYVNESDLVNYYMEYLEQYLDGNIPVFTCEYALDYADSAYKRSYDKGYIPYVTRRSLSRLTTTPPTGYGAVGQIDLQKGNITNTPKLEQNYPNPFNPKTYIKYYIPSKSHVLLKVYDLKGSLLKTLVDKEQSEGVYNIEFNSPIYSSQVFVYSLIVQNSLLNNFSFIDTRKMILLK